MSGPAGIIVLMRLKHPAFLPCVNLVLIRLVSAPGSASHGREWFPLHPADELSRVFSTFLLGKESFGVESVLFYLYLLFSPLIKEMIQLGMDFSSLFRKCS